MTFFGLKLPPPETTPGRRSQSPAAEALEEQFCCLWQKGFITNLKPGQIKTLESSMNSGRYNGLLFVALDFPGKD